ncbi:polyprenyl diphosphate synthase [Methanolobus halotolerans]|uniref:Tritrans,polycis-undecaprenyl-diphosphate synthase (geranylgeranyl-diphosphate specific) n=1 Tax=Methanolobus halotolerans TaxID=2052935 RepID=A0A4E0Q4E9_9EURY|nr:polyprenyl diphosphate synthase [Methanolobus halotolerans]TGC08527.1 di-trans,poly-cis-decaprenylcistransferase [Methanolobus halotolerans]
MLKRIPQLIYRGYEHLLTQEVKNAPIPRHVAIIMDGNRRYARKMGQISDFGHFRGANRTEKVIEWSCELGIKHLTIYAFSTENFNRPSDEKNNLFDLIRVKFNEIGEDERTHKRRMRVHAIGDIEKLPEQLQESIKNVELVTSAYDKFNLNVAIAYGGRQEIVQAVREIASKVEKGEISLEDINEDTISNHLYPSRGAALPNVDLIIRTGGDERVSNFLPWQANGNECASYFCAPFWPEFRKIDFLRSVRVYQTRTEERRQQTAVRAAHFLKVLGKAEVNEVRQLSKAGKIH